jgi:hypothetical protein
VENLRAVHGVIKEATMAAVELGRDKINALGSRDENEVISPTLLMHFPSVPSAQKEQIRFCAVRGFEIPSFPGLDDKPKGREGELEKTILYRFQRYITQLHAAQLHGAAPFRVFALQFMSHPDEAERGSRVRAYLLCGSADEDRETAGDEAYAFAEEARESFPRDGIFAYGTPKPLDAAALTRVLFLSPEHGPLKINIVELRKREDAQSWPGVQMAQMAYVPHRLWSDEQSDPWLPLIETLGEIRTETAIRIELTPAVFDDSAKLFVANTARAFNDIEADLKRLSSQGDKSNLDNSTPDAARKPTVMAAREDALHRNYIMRGDHVYEHLNTFSETSFRMRLMIVSRGALPSSVIGGVRNAVSVPAADNPSKSAGWGRLDQVSPSYGERDTALDNLNYLAQTCWGPVHDQIPLNPPGAPSARVSLDGRIKPDSCIDLRSLVTPEEAVALFHLPIYDRAGQTSAVSTVDTPFVIPPEMLSTDRDNESGGPNNQKKKRIILGYMYQRDRLLKPIVVKPNEQDQQRNGNKPTEVTTEDPGQPFHVTVDDLMKPSLLVGGPGSGKTNLAFSILIELAKKEVPFLVLDPSTAQEFRMLVGRPERSLDELLVYTVGDSEANPFAFNPFSVPPDVTVRAHITGLLAAFGAAIEMKDPIPAIFEGALERLYAGVNMTLASKGDPTSPAPTFTQFGEAMRKHLDEKVLPLYAGSRDVIGSIRGQSTMRVNAIGKRLGYILNAEGNSSRFFQEILRRPTVIEFGKVGDATSIALVLGFFLLQLAGHIEKAHQDDDKRRHLIVIEEAHRVLSGHGEGGGANKSAEDLNTMLAEVRKFGQGILVMDQRPSSLVGGVLDNAFTALLMRLSDKVGFERLSAELNLNDAQQRFARTRFKVGDFIALDRTSGQPLLLNVPDVMGPLRHALDAWGMAKPWQQLAKAMGNEAEDLKRLLPKVVDYEEMALDGLGTDSGAIAIGAKLDGAAAALAAVINSAKGDAYFYWRVKKPLVETGDVDAALALVRRQMQDRRPALDQISDERWEKALEDLTAWIAEQKVPAEVNVSAMNVT